MLLTDNLFILQILAQAYGEGGYDRNSYNGNQQKNPVTSGGTQVQSPGASSSAKSNSDKSSSAVAQPADSSTSSTEEKDAASAITNKRDNWQNGADMPSSMPTTGQVTGDSSNGISPMILAGGIGLVVLLLVITVALVIKKLKSKPESQPASSLNGWTNWQ